MKFDNVETRLQFVRKIIMFCRAKAGTAGGKRRGFVDGFIELTYMYNCIIYVRQWCLV